MTHANQHLLKHTFKVPKHPSYDAIFEKHSQAKKRVAKRKS